MDDDNTVGAVLPSESIPTKSMLDGMGENKVVAVFNPLPQPFRVQYARTLAYSGPKTESQRKTEEKLGTALDKDMSTGVGHSVQYHVLKAGQTENLPGDIAQIAVRQLRNYILQQENKGKNSNKVADPAAQAEVEKRIVIQVVDNVTFMNQMSTEDYTAKQLQDLNPAVDKKEPVAANPPPGQGANF